MNFIKLANHLVTIDGLTSNALYAYCHIYKWQNFELRELRTSHILLADDIELCKKQADNRSRIKAALCELEKEELICMEQERNVLSIKFIADWNERFTKIPFHLTENVSPSELHVIAYILKWSYARSQISFDEWSRVLRVSYSTAVKRLHEMDKQGIISISPGHYYQVNDTMKQDINKYKVEGAKYGEDAARDLARKQGYALMGEYEKVLGEDGLALAKKAFYKEDGMVYCRDVSGYGMEQRKKFLDGVKQKENRK